MSKQNKNQAPSTANQQQHSEQNKNPQTGTQNKKNDQQY